MEKNREKLYFQPDPNINQQKTALKCCHGNTEKGKLNLSSDRTASHDCVPAYVNTLRLNSMS